MVQARYSFGCVFFIYPLAHSDQVPQHRTLPSLLAHRYYGSILPSALNVFALQGFLVLNSIVGGQTLAAVSDTLSWNVGIVIIAVISLFVRLSHLSEATITRAGD